MSKDILLKVSVGASVESIRPSKLYEKSSIPYDKNSNLTHLRYTSVEGNPEEFSNNNYKLKIFDKNIKLLICVTMYSEEAKELDFTLKHGICENIINFASCGLQKTITWENIAVVIVSDGYQKVNKSTLQYATDYGFFDERLLYEYKTPNVSMHLFEFTTQFEKSKNKYFPPLQTIFAIKQHNGGKLDSHYWFFTAFCKQIDPTYVFLIDVGTKPESHSIVKLYVEMERNLQIGGCCGEIAVNKPNYCSLVQAAQHYEYKTSNFMGKCMESLFGYISVLPGAFSAYRYKAVKGEPLQRYFYSIKNSLSPFKANMYLAEDRILCFEILTKKNCDWILHYVKDARAVTDVPETIAALIKQRRRWLNGSFFSQIYTVSHFSKLWLDSSHSLFRKFFFTLEFWYFFISAVVSWFNVGTYYLSNHLIMNEIFSYKTKYFDPTKSTVILGFHWQTLLVNVIEFIWVFLLIIQVIISMRNKPEEIRCLQTFCCVIFGIINYFMLFLICYWLYFLGVPVWIAELTIAIFTAPIVAAIFHFEVFSIVFTTLQYYFMLPTYINVFVIYSISNIHDVSWGTKGIESEHKAYINLNTTGKNKIEIEKEKIALIQKQKKEIEQRENHFKRYSSHFLIFWMFCNVLWVSFMSFLKQNEFYNIGILSIIVFQSGFLFLFSIIFVIKFYLIKLWFCLVYIFTCMCCREQQFENPNRNVSDRMNSDKYLRRHESV
jgi:chitin synthase